MASPGTTSGELTLVLDRVIEDLGSGFLFQLKPGDDVHLSGPYGNFTVPEPLDRELLLIARYTGPSPYAAY